jgi:hypothetical protein
MIKKVNLLVIGRNFFSSSRAKWRLEMKQIESGQKILSPTRLLPLMLVITAILALAMTGVAVAKKCDNPPCEGGGNDSSSYYSVDITGEVDGAGLNWTEGKNGQIGYNHFETDPPSEGVLDLAFFQNYFNSIEAGRGENCFPIDDVLLHAVILDYKKSTGARAIIWFHGETYQGTTPVLYQLTLFGPFNKNNWPPADGSTHPMVMLTWRMRLENEGNNTQQISCLIENQEFTGEEVPIKGVSIKVKSSSQPWDSP